MILMAGIDFNLAPLELRERFSFTDESLREAYARVKTVPGVLGAVLIPTCNRTELVVSSDGGLDVFGLLCGLAGADGCGCPHYSAGGTEVMRHMCRLGSGAKSQILGEDQIITQVKDAIAKSRDCGAADGNLEVLFRESVAAAKRIKSEIKLGVREDSIAARALEVIRGREGITRALVIGNGEIGRLTARLLVENGYHTTMTLRSYRHGETIVPPRVKTVDYAERYARIADCDVLISATRSPHHTITWDEAQHLKIYPKLWLDLAVPRDIDPEIVKFPGVEYYDADDLSGGEKYEARGEKEALVAEIVEKYAADFEKWLDYQQVINGGDKKEYFPLFVSSKGKKALVAGGGKIASRRAQTLTRFEFDVTVVAPEVLPEIEHLHSKGRLTLIRRGFADEDLDGCFLAVAATDDRGVNRRIGELAAERGIFASVADSRDECGFLFPAIAVGGDIVAGLTSGGKSHHSVVQAAKRVREIL